jgi:hypothetical protein
MIRNLVSIFVLQALLASIQAADQVVTDAGDNGGANQLRAKLTALQSSGGGTLTFNVGAATIVLTNGVLPSVITNSTVDGGGTVTISGANSTYIFGIESGGTLTLNNITVTRGFNGGGDGGAIRNFGTLNINNCKLLQNQTASGFSGGAILSVGPLNITNSEFGANQAGNGGALYPRFSTGVTAITGCNFHDNATINTTNGLGGAILLWDGAQVTISSGTFSANTAGYGGGIYITQNSTLSIGNSTLSGNSAAYGGGIYDDGTATLANVILSSNSAAYYAGMYNGGTATLTSVTLSGNSATYGGGGIFNYGTATLTNVTVSGNSALDGGGIYLYRGIATLTNVTLSGNSARSEGGGIDYRSGFGTVTLKNTLIAKGATGANCVGLAGGSFNLSDDNSCGFGAGRDNVNLLLGPLANNGGFTQTHLPQAGSAAIDNATGNGAPARDQRGYVRAGAAPDVGAAEFGGTIPVTLANISTRLAVQTGDNVLIGGFIITGTQQKKVILRAIGPSLNLPGKLADPTLELYQGQTLLEGNDNWMDSPNKQAIIDSTIAPSDPLESAIVRSLAPGPYTAVVRGANNGTGIGVVEAYDLDRTVDSKLANISTRGAVQTGDNVLFAGFIVLGPDSQKVIIRALAPSVPVPGTLSDPTLELHDANGGILETNDNWVDSANKQAIIDSTIPPTNNLESAIVRTLTPANYTAIVRGVNNTTGIAVVEVYALP